MAYLEDLSEYTYAHSSGYRPVTKAVGWLGRGHEFEIARPSEELLDLLWQYCKVAVEQMRGITYASSVLLRFLRPVIYRL